MEQNDDVSRESVKDVKESLLDVSKREDAMLSKLRSCATIISHFE